ncbi:MAG: TolC family protein [Planctomycetota bacterium]
MEIMQKRFCRQSFAIGLGLWAGMVSLGSVGHAQEAWQPIHPEQRCLQIRDPSDLCQVPVTASSRPPTVSDPQLDQPEQLLTLNEAINVTLENSEVVRVLAGQTASRSGRTIYDSAITNTTIDSARATFDPTLSVDNTWSETKTPTASFQAFPNVFIENSENDRHQLSLFARKQNQLGGVWDLTVASNRSRFANGLSALNPRISDSSRLRYTQPFLSGYGRAANEAPIVLARIDTERSFFAYKNAVQSSVRGVIDAYWNLVLAKTNLWAIEQQVEQATFALEQEQARVDSGNANEGELAQAKLALERFKASRLSSRANVLQQQAALLNMMNLPPYEPVRLVPSTPPNDERVAVDWLLINELAQRQRPDIIELKLILEADQQRLLVADNEAQPRLDGVAAYQWNGLQGTVPTGGRLRGDGQDWTLGVNFSVPIGLRGERSRLRQRQLLLQRDRANLDQQLKITEHLLAQSMRNLDTLYSQYERFQAVREAARVNLEQQLAQFEVGRAQFIVVLQAIVSWGEAVTQEALSLTQYNTGLAELELQTGTILESHNVFFFEERFRAIGPIGRCGETVCYPRSQPPTPTVVRYDDGSEPSEESFDLNSPAEGVVGTLDSEKASDGMIEMDEELDFNDADLKQMDRDGDGKMSDEEIDALLEANSSRSRRDLADFLRMAPGG